jgi:hypothetical protein
MHEDGPELASASAWPPPPHDPRERDLVMRLGEWEVRVFSGRKFEHFVSRGFWHLQLWHPVARVSVLSPSRLTRGFYEAYPVARWKAQAETYERLVTLIAGTCSATFPSEPELRRIERALVDDVVRATSLVS